MISRRVSQTQKPPLIELGKLAASQNDCISLGQGAPYYSPPAWVFDQMQKDYIDPSTHRYTADPGLEEVRRSVAKKLEQDQQITINPDHIILTPGANQACYNTLATLTDPGDEIILLTPYYFNHAMACTLLNVKPVPVPLSQNFDLDLEAIEEAITTKTKAIVLVNPGNPTGKVHRRKELQELVELAGSHGLGVIADETYEYFTYDGTSHVPLAQLDREAVIGVGSFSKTFGIPGWRLGYYFGPEEFMEQSLKVQDTIGICAPRPTQMLGAKLIEHRKEIIPPIVEKMVENHHLAKSLLDEISWLEQTPSSGAYYLFPRQLTGKPTVKLVRELIRDYGVYIVPGEGFGSRWSDHCRISFANVTEGELQSAFERLGNYLG